MQDGIGEETGITGRYEDRILVGAEKLMVGGGIPQDHGLVHCPVDIGFAGDRPGGLLNAGIEMSGDAQVAEGDMACQVFLHKPVLQTEVWHILYLLFQNVRERPNEIKVIVRPIPQGVKGFQNDLISLQGKHAAEEEDGVTFLKHQRFGHCHWMIEDRIGLQVEQSQLILFGMELFHEIAAVAAGITDDRVGACQCAAVQPVQKFSEQTFWPDDLSVTAEGVVDRDEEVDHAVCAFEFPCKKGQDQLRCETDKDGIIVSGRAEQKPQVYVKQPDRIGFFIGADNAELGGILLQQADFLRVSDIIQPFRGDEQYLFIFYVCYHDYTFLSKRYYK